MKDREQNIKQTVEEDLQKIETMQVTEENFALASPAREGKILYP